MIRLNLRLVRHCFGIIIFFSGLLCIPTTLVAESQTTYVTAIVQFPMGSSVTSSQAKAAFEASAPNYKKVPGLIRKYYLFGEGGTGGGVYLWESRTAAEALYTKEWRGNLEQRFGTAPTITFFETPVVVDNAK